MNRTATAERLGERFFDGLEGVSPRGREGQAGIGRDGPGRFDIVEGGRRGPSAPAPQETPFSRVQTAAWTPVPARGQNGAVEQYRRLAAALIHAQAERGVRSILITSSVAGEGKSLTTANLAVTLARSFHRRTLVIDADRRAPSLHEIFRVPNARGLSEQLRSDERPAPAIQLQEGLALLPAGCPTHDPVGGLTSPRMRQLIADSSEAFDFTLIDTPPAALVPDAGLLAPAVDAIVLVVGAASTPIEIVQRTVASLGKDRVLGTVLNRAEQTVSGRYGYGYYGYPAR